MGNRWSRGLSDRIPPEPYLEPWEADFIAEKRRAGVPDADIAKMLDCTLKRIRDHVVVDASKIVIPKIEDEVKVRRRIPLITPEERRARDAKFRDIRVWKPDPKPRPVPTSGR